MTTDLWFGTSGPHDARIAIVGESWGSEEAAAKRPFVGASGKELDRMLAEANINRAEVFCTNVIAAKPQGNETCRFFLPHARGNENVRGLAPSSLVKSELIRLGQQLNEVQPSVILAAGNYALWALTNCTSTTSTSLDGTVYRTPAGITSWRGSMWWSEVLTSQPFKLVPIIHPAAILREWSLRSTTVHDLKTRVPLALSNDWRPQEPPAIIAPPTFEQALLYFGNLLRLLDAGEETWLVHDIETSRGNITCMGFGHRPNSAVVLPLVRLDENRSFSSYWLPEQEQALFPLIRRILTHPCVKVIGQNYIYDTQYMQQQFAITPRLTYDTMIGQHVLLPGTPKGLDHLSSLYCHYHWYWKDDGKEWDTKGTLEQHLQYNGEDIIRTYEIAAAQRPLVAKAGLEAQYDEQMQFLNLALEMMNRGVRIDTTRRAQLGLDLSLAAEDLEAWFESIIPDAHVKEVVEMKTKNAKPWWRSPTQQRKYFTWLGLRLPRNRKTGRETFGKEALLELRGRHPEYTRLFDGLEDSRSIGVFHNTFVKAPLEPRDRMRCSYNVAGPETYRWSSSENAFGRGTNLQNIPAGEEE